MDEITRGQRRFDIGTAVIDANGERIGHVTGIHDGWIQVTPGLLTPLAWQVPRCDIAVDGEHAIVLSVDKDALTPVIEGFVGLAPTGEEVPLAGEAAGEGSRCEEAG
ncbi:MAG: hypothetical protein IT337_04295 [Thermomicrobiales bacterium]|nr:hypothetical protein [Thermomicrobiales bacterium]